MEPFSVLGIFIIVILVLSLGRIISHSLRFLFYALLTVFVLIFVFGISFNEVLSWITDFVMLVF